MTFLGPIRELKSQSKLQPQNLERQAITENHSPDLLIRNKKHWSHELVGTSGNLDKFLEAECRLFDKL